MPCRPTIWANHGVHRSLLRGTLGLSLLAGLLLTSSASAAVYQLSGAFSFLDLPAGYPGDPWATTFSITRFNESVLDPLEQDPKDTLVRIDLVLAVQMSGKIALLNTFDPQTVNVIFGADVGVTSVFSGQSFELSPQYTAAVDLQTSVPVEFDVPGTATATAGSYFSTNSTDLVNFAGEGSITANAVATTLSPSGYQLLDQWLLYDPTGKTGIYGGDTFEAITGTWTVYYHTPEPGALALLALGVLAGLCRRSRRIIA